MPDGWLKKAAGTVINIIPYASLLYGAFRFFDRPKNNVATYKGGAVEVKATTNTPVPVCYGNCEVTGNIIYKEDTLSATNELAVGLCEGPIQSIDSVMVNGVSIPVYPTEFQGCSYTPHYGTAAQTTDARFTTSLMQVTCSENNFVDEANPADVQDYYSTDRLFVADNQSTGNEMYTFLKFNISSLNLTASSDISSATLRLTVGSNTATANHTLYVYEMADDSWTETTVTWNNKPGFGDQITTLAGSLIVQANSVFCDIDVTQWVKDTFDYDASKIVGIGLKLDTASSGTAQVILASRDSGGAPKLMIGYSPKELVAFAHTAYIALTIKDSDLFRGNLNEIKVRLHGREIYDGDVNPNYSTNPAWCVYDQLTSARYGADIPSALINAASFTAVASYCDTAITNEDGVSEARFRCDAVFDDKDTVENRVNDILASFGGYLYMLDGKLNIGVDCAASSEHTFTVNNIIDGSFSYWLIDKSRQPNDVSVMYYDAANDFKASYVNVKDQSLIDTYGRNFEEIQLRCVNRYSQASRMAKYYLNKSVYSQYGCSFAVSINNCDVAPGDVCTITHAVAGWTNELFRIVSVQEDDNDEIIVTCEEYDAGLYSDDGLPYTPPEGGNLPNPNEVPPVVTALTLTESHAQGDDGTYIPQIKVDWTVPDYIFPLNYIVWYKPHAAADYIYWELSTDNLAYINTDGAGQYDVRVQTVNILTGLKTDFGTSPSETITLAGKTAPPSDVSFNDANSTFYLEIYLEWLPVADSDLAYYEVRTDTNWGNATNLVYQGKGTAYIMANPALTTYTFYIKARDLSDNYSDNADSITLTKADPVLGSITTDFTGRDCFLTWEHTEDKDFIKYTVKVYSDAARTALVRTENIASPPYIYTYDNNKADNSGTAIRHPYFTIIKNSTLSQNASQNSDDDNAAPGAPTGLTLTPGQGKLFVSWTALADSDIIGYNVYAKTSSPANTLVAFVNATNFTFDPESENTYYVTVAGVDAFGEGTKCSEVTQTTNPYALTNYNLDVPITAGVNYTVAAGKVKWSTGKLWYEDAEYTIAAETTGKDVGYIYWDKDSPTVFQHSATPPALDDDVWVMAYFDGTDVSAAFAQKIIHGGLIQASSIEADKLSVDDLSAISANLGTVTSGTMQTAASGQRAVMDGVTNTLKFYDATNVDPVIKFDDNIISTRPGVKIESAEGAIIAMYDSNSDGPQTIITEQSIETATLITGYAILATQLTADGNIIVADYDVSSGTGTLFEGRTQGTPVFSVDSNGDIDANKITTVDDIKAGDKLIFNRTNDVTIDATSPASGALTYTIPDAGAAASFVMTEGAQTINGVKTLGSFAVTPSSAPTTDYQVANKKYVDDNAGGGPHAVLSATHSDSTAGEVSRGSIITGQGSTPKWAELTIGTNGYYLKSDGTDVAWAAVTATPAGSDSYVQYNNGGALGGDVGMVYDDTNERLTVTCILAGGQNYFSTQSADLGFTDGLLVTSNGDLGAGEFGASIAFSKNSSVTRHAAIAVKQQTSDSDQIGLSIFTHPSGTGSDPMVEAIEIDHNGNIHLKNGATVFKEIHVPYNQFKLRGTSDPALGKMASNTGTVGVYVYLFEHGGTDEIFGAIVLPQDYKAGANIYPHIHRKLDVAPDNTTDDFRIGLEFTWCEEDGTMSATTTNELEITVGADADTKLLRSELTAISGSGHAPGSTLAFRLYREVIVTGVDTESGVFITSLDFEYEADRLGADATTV